MDKIKLRLCAGTMCYVMGGAQLMEIEELLSEEEKQGIGNFSTGNCFITQLLVCNGVTAKIHLLLQS